MKVAILGTGYVGLTTGVCFAYLGHKVVCLDPVESKITSLRAGRIPIFEPGLAELMKEAEANLSFTTEYAEAVPGAEVIFIAVGTPPQADGSPDLRYLRAASESIGQHLGETFAVVVNKSTVPIGSGNWVEALIRTSFEKHHSERADGRFAVASNPEFLREGSALADTLYADRIVVGSDNPRVLEIMYTLYRPLIDQNFPAPPFLPRPAECAAVPMVSSDLASAELIKYAANAFLALKISFINEIGNLAERVGADVREIARGIGLDTRIGPRFLQAGLGWGGSCFGKDTSALVSTAAEYGLSMPIVNAAREVNNRQRVRVIEKLLAELRILKGRTISLLGLAFKPDTDDLRDAPSLDIAKRLEQHGAIVRAHDPVAMEKFRTECDDLQVELAPTPEELFDRADAVLLVTEWKQYRDLDWAGLKDRMRTPLIVDGRGFLDPAEIEAAGYRLVTIP
jgi:UDPglucose 6-dehydrogenase